jgi:hypothetical protein
MRDEKGLVVHFLVWNAERGRMQKRSQPCAWMGRLTRAKLAVPHPG